MEKFIDKHTQKITGTIACFDRILFKGYLPISWAENMERFILSQGLLFKDFKTFVTKQSERIKQHAKAMAEKNGRPYIHINGRIRKEEKAREIAGRDGITDGLICVLSCRGSLPKLQACLWKGSTSPGQCPTKVPVSVFLSLRPRVRFHACPYSHMVSLYHSNLPEWTRVAGRQTGSPWYRCIKSLKMPFYGSTNPNRAQRFSNRFAKKKWPRILQFLGRSIQSPAQRPFAIHGLLLDR